MTVTAVRTCSVEGCDRKHKGHGFCVGHLCRVKKTGSVGTTPLDRGRGVQRGPQNGVWKDAPSYAACHMRVRSARGLATDHACASCGRQAAHWAYTHDDPTPLFNAKGQPYSADVNRYQPMCVPCHKRFDLNQARPS